MVDYADLDGAFLISNDVFEGTTIDRRESNPDGSTGNRGEEAIVKKNFTLHH